MKTSIITIITLFTFSTHAGWSESHGGDGVVSEFKMIASILLKEMKNDPQNFSFDFTSKLEKEIEDTIIVSSEEPLILDGVERDAINHTLARPYKIEVARARWLQYESSFDIQAKLVLHEFLFTLHIDDSNYLKSAEIYRILLSSRMIKNDKNLLGPLFLQSASTCNTVRASSLVFLGVNPNYRDSENRNAFFMAASTGCEELVNQSLGMDIFSLKTYTDSWDPLFAAFVGSLQPTDPNQIEKFSNIINKVATHYFSVDENTDAKFNSNEFPFQLNPCEGQTMFIRSLIGIYFYTDESKTDVKFVRNLKISGLLKKLGASMDLKDACGKSAHDYAALYNIDLNQI